MADDPTNDAGTPDPTKPPVPTTPPPAPTKDPDGDPGFHAPRDQAEFDRMIGERLARERSKFDGYDDFRAKAEQFDALEEQNKTELQRATEAATAADQRATLAEWRLVDQAIRNAVVAEAAKANAIDPDEIVTLLDVDALTIDDAGMVTGADTAVANLLERKPHLVRPGNQPRPDFDAGTRSDGTGNKPGQPWQVQSRDELRGKSPEEIEALRTGGHLNELLGITT